MAMVEERLARVRTLMEERRYDAMVIRNVADLRWLTGCARVFDDEVAHTAYVTADACWLHTDSRYFGAITDGLSDPAAWSVDMDQMAHAAWVAERVAETRPLTLAIEDTLTLAFFESLEHELSSRSRSVLMPRLHADVAALRVIKDEEELALLRRAQEITDAAFDHIAGVMNEGMSELELRAELEGYMLGHGAEALSFDTIMAAGENGANPHARPSGRKVARGDMVVMDYGACYHDYHADMTRTVCLGEAGEEERRVYDIVRRAHEACAKAARPDILGKDLHNLAARVIEEAGFGGCFNHGLGHGVGIEIHELPSVGRLGEKGIPVGAVFTIEPGIYLRGRFGVRLEDTGVMGGGGFEPFATSTHDLVCVG